ncbi:CDP-alcohol phosphatidyltransferase family protein [Vibrio sp. 10N.261.52.C2]|uniref:CDP-alcohol phosphatidyltransferase family protein n=1 Tax=Vibrio sp. 10N.261.52.C2 TaxID=3229681 RepID=UPI0035512E99
MNISFSDFEKFKAPVSMWCVKHIYQNMSYPFFLLAYKCRLSPNTVTVLSLLFFIFGGFFFVAGWYLYTLVFWVISYVLDCTDGSLARATKKTSVFGAFLDVSIDRFCSTVYLLLIYSKLSLGYSFSDIQHWIVMCGAVGIVYNSFISMLRVHYFPWLKGYAKRAGAGVKFKILKITYEALDTGNVYVLTCLAFYFEAWFEVFLFYFILTGLIIAYNFWILFHEKQTTLREREYE